MDHSKLEGRRRGIGTTGDVRAARTKRALSDALRRHTRPELTSELSVASVSRTAGVSRATFYTHFADVDALVAFSVRELFDELISNDVEMRRTHDLDRREIGRLSLRRLIDAFVDHREVLPLVLASDTRSSMHSRLVDLVETTIRSAIALEHPRMPERFAARASVFIGSAISAVVFDYLATDPLDDPEILVEDILALVPRWILGGEYAAADPDAGQRSSTAQPNRPAAGC